MEQRSAPVKESATCRLLHIVLPISNNIDLPCVEVELIALTLSDNILKNNAFAMVHDSLSKKIKVAIKAGTDCFHEIGYPCIKGFLEFLFMYIDKCSLKKVVDLISQIAIH